MYKQFEKLPAELNLNSRALTNGAYVNSTEFGCGGYEQLTLEIIYTYGAGTAVIFYLETSPDGTNWCREQTKSTTAGVATLSDSSYSKAISAASDNWTVNIPINYKNIRLGFTATSGNGTTDVVTVYARLGVST